MATTKLERKNIAIEIMTKPLFSFSLNILYLLKIQRTVELNILDL